MYDSYTVLRVWKRTARKLKILAALGGESMIALIERLAVDEFQKRAIPLPDEREGGGND